MKSKYGNIPNDVIKNSLGRLVSKVYKLLPLKEEGCETLTEYIEGMIRELIGQAEIIPYMKCNDEFLSLLGTLESLIGQDELKIYRKDVFKSISLIKKIQGDIE